MPSILPGFEYDIFISYRHNDNKSGWVSEFVNNLQEELSATIKEPVSVYFDSNLHDGLLETHNVDKTLQGKLKCLIFIPIISQTYCDTNSFAWQQEFLVYRNQAGEDQFGLHVRLSNGNVTSRILPVKIHDLDPDDKAILENELSGHLRSIDFIYREPGVNRPLRAKDDDSSDASHKIKYRNQVNKVAQAVKEIIYALKNSRGVQRPVETVKPINTSQPFLRKRTTVALLAFIILIAAAFTIYYLPGNYSDDADEKSIAVLPFVNISDDKDQEFFCDGLTEEIITQLSNVKNLVVISRSSSMTLKGSQLNLKDIARQLDVQFILEGSIRRSGNNLLITAQLIDANLDKHLWAEKFNGTLDDVFDIQEKVSRSIVSSLKIRLTPAESERFSQHSFDNAQAYELYLRAKPEIRFNEASNRRAVKYLENGLDIVGPNPILYGGIAYSYWSIGNMGIDMQVNFDNARKYMEKAFALDPESPEATLVKGLMSKTPEEGARNFLKILPIRPYDSDVLAWLTINFCIMGKLDAAEKMAEKLVRADPLNPLSMIAVDVVKFHRGQFEGLSEKMIAFQRTDPGNAFDTFSCVTLLDFENRDDEAIEFIQQNIKTSNDMISKMTLAFSHALKNEPDSVLVLLSDAEVQATIDPQYCQMISLIYARGGLQKESIKWLDKAITLGFTNYIFLESLPPYSGLRDKAEFKALLKIARDKESKIQF